MDISTLTPDQIRLRYRELGKLISEIRSQSNDGADLMKATGLTAATASERATELNGLLDEYEAIQPEFNALQQRADRLGSVAATHQTLAAPTQRVAAPVVADRTEIRFKPAKTRNFKGPDAGLHAYAFGQHLRAHVLSAINPRLAAQANEWLDEHGFQGRTMNESDNQLGGVLVNDQIEQDLIDLREQYGVTRQFAKIRVMTSDTMSINRRTGGLQVYAVGETGAATESAKHWDKVQLVAKDFAVLASFSQNLSDDAIISVADDLAGESAYAFALWEDQCFFTADGSGTYNGITGLTQKFKDLSATRANIAGAVVGTGNAWSELVLADFLSVQGKLPVYARPNGAWFTSAVFYDTVMNRVALSAGGVSQREIIESYNNPMFLGKPVHFVQVMPTTEANDQIVCFYGDISKSSDFGDRKQTSFAIDTSLGFKERVVWAQAVERFDINHHDIGNADASAANRVVGPVTALFTAAS